jgi:AAA15 family ATPase/GTPase
LLEILNYRGEFSWSNDQEFNQNFLESRVRRMKKDFNIRHLFYGHKIELDKRFFIEAIIDKQKVNLQVSVTNKNLQMSLFNDDVPEFYLSLERLDKLSAYEIPLEIPLSNEGNISIFSLKKNRAILKNSLKFETKFVTPYERDTEVLTRIFDEISLTDKENVVIDALKIIEPKILRIATQKSETGTKNSFKILLAGYEQPIPIGSMGDGIWRLLTIALAMVSTQNGILLIDEIDSGLHFSTLLKMWELVFKTAEKLNIQVFATTHSSDCWTSLADFINKQNISEKSSFNQPNKFTIHRIEPDKNQSIIFDEKKIVIAANRDIEVR